MSPPGRPKGEFLRPEAEGSSMSPPGRHGSEGARAGLNGEFPRPEAEGSPVNAFAAVELAEAAGAQAGEFQRRAALLLHGLAGPDREWVLGGLRPAQAEHLRALLQDLVQLGLPADEDFVRQALAPAAAAAAAPPEPASLAAEALAAADAQQVREVLAPEPDPLVVAVLAAGRWPWASAFYAGLAPARAQRLRDLGQVGSVPPGLRQAAVQALVQALHDRRRLDDAAAVPLPTPQRRWWQRLAGRSAA
jgi:hypothetical protein